MPPSSPRAAEEVERLVSLGATRLDAREDGTVAMADPDGNDFRLTTGRPQA